MECRQTGLTSRPTGGSTMRRWGSTSPRQVSTSFVRPVQALHPVRSADYKTGFGGQFGVQSDRVDRSAVGWEHHEQVDKHESQTGELPLDLIVGISFILLNENHLK